MNNYTFAARSEAEKIHALGVIRAARATVTGGSGNHIRIAATPEQAHVINRALYRSNVHSMTASQVINAWNVGDLTAELVLVWQQRHGVNLGLGVSRA